ncbi:MAG TPA: hypothetical protein VNI84_18180, partial [Pyrinomonadaceae bacterium]|nr:hypothetical protein [Pyrinomonadaceae bacterium]
MRLRKSISNNQPVKTNILIRDTIKTDPKVTPVCSTNHEVLTIGVPSGEFLSSIIIFVGKSLLDFFFIEDLAHDPTEFFECVW